MEIVTGTTSTEGDVDVLKASYAYGPVTATYSLLDYDVSSKLAKWPEAFMNIKNF